MFGIDLEKKSKEATETFVAELGEKLKQAFVSLARKENCSQSELQLAIRYKNSFPVHKAVEDAFRNYGSKFGVKPEEVQLAIRFKESINSNDADFEFQVMKQWQPYKRDNFIGKKHLPVFTEHLQKRLYAIAPAKNFPGVTKWSQVAVILHKTPNADAAKPMDITMTVFAIQEGKMQPMLNFDFSKEIFRDQDDIYYQVLKNFKVLRPASFSKDFLGNLTIMPDLTGKEMLVKAYVVGINTSIMGHALKMESQLEAISLKYETDWDNCAIVFVKTEDNAEPEACICIVDENGVFAGKEKIALFSSAEEQKQN